MILPEHVYGEIPVENWQTDETNRSPLGSGPFVFQEFRSGELISLEDPRGADERDLFGTGGALSGDAPAHGTTPRHRQGCFTSVRTALHPPSMSHPLEDFKSGPAAARWTGGSVLFDNPGHRLAPPQRDEFGVAQRQRGRHGLRHAAKTNAVCVPRQAVEVWAVVAREPL